MEQTPGQHTTSIQEAIDGGFYTEEAAQMRSKFKSFADASDQYVSIHGLMYLLETHLTTLGKFALLDPLGFSTDQVYNDHGKYLLSYLDKARCVYELVRVNDDRPPENFPYNVRVYHPAFYTQNGVDKFAQLQNQ
jgi:hypothetical protein